MALMQTARLLMEAMVSGCSGPSNRIRRSSAWRKSGSTTECLLRGGEGGRVRGAKSQVYRGHVSVGVFRPGWGWEVRVRRWTHYTHITLQLSIQYVCTVWRMCVCYLCV